jgi:hypothetical protein
MHIVLVGFLLLIVLLRILPWGRRCRDRIVVGFTTTYAISAYRKSMSKDKKDYIPDTKMFPKINYLTLMSKVT